MQPIDRKSFKQFVLRRLGAPVIKINLSEDQIDDCVDQALYLYQQYHFDGTEKLYIPYCLTMNDINNQYITMSEATDQTIISITKIFPVGQSIGTNSLFNMRYQFVLNDLYNFSNVSLVPYYLTLQHVQFMEEMLVGQKPIRYARHNNILYIDMDWSIVTENEWIVIECFGTIDPDTFADVWTDKWLQDYATALMKKNWGQVLSIYSGLMPSGLQINGPLIYQQALQDIAKCEHDLLLNYTKPPLFGIQ